MCSTWKLRRVGLKLEIDRNVMGKYLFTPCQYSLVLPPKLALADVTMELLEQESLEPAVNAKPPHIWYKRQWRDCLGLHLCNLSRNACSS